MAQYRRGPGTLIESRPEAAKTQHACSLHVHSCDGTVGESPAMSLTYQLRLPSLVSVLFQQLWPY